MIPMKSNGVLNTAAPPSPTERKGHRHSDPKFSEHDLNEAVDMGDHAVWANLEENIYAEKDFEIFRVHQKDSSLPTYYIKGWMPFSADTVFNTLVDFKYRKQWDSSTKQLYVIEKIKDSAEIAYWLTKFPWPLSNRDYVYYRSMKYFPEENSFVIISQSGQHHSTPECNGVVRVETFSSKISIRSTGTNSCDFHVVYEDDSNFSVPNYFVNLLVATNVPSLLNEFRTACSSYMTYAKTLDDNAINTIPSQVMRRKAEENLKASNRFTSVSPLNSTTTATTKSVVVISRTTAGTENRKLQDHSLSSPSSSSFEAKRKKKIKKAGSMGKFFSKTSSGVINEDEEDTVEDFCVEFFNQKIGLHLETEVFTNKVVVASIEKNSEASKSNVCIEPGFVITSINDVSVMEMNFNQVMDEIKKSGRPMIIGFTHPDKASSKKYRKFQANTGSSRPNKNAFKVAITKEHYQQVCMALQPVYELNGIGFGAKLSQEMEFYRAKHYGQREPAKKYVVPNDFYIKELDGNRVADLPLTEIIHLLKRQNDTITGTTTMEAIQHKVLRFKPPKKKKKKSKKTKEKAKSEEFLPRVIGGETSEDQQFEDDTATETRQRSLSRKFSNVFIKWRSKSFENVQAREPSVEANGPVVQNEQESNEDTTTASQLECLNDYGSIVVTPKNIEWAWRHVEYLKSDERLFSAGLLIDKIEACLMHHKNDVESLSMKNIFNAMHNKRQEISKIKERREIGLQALQDFGNEEHAEWRFAQTYFGISTHWKPGENGTVWLKLDGICEGVDIFNSIAVLRETDLYSLWAPFCNHSKLLKQVGRVELVAYLSVAIPLMMRDAVVHAFGINAAYEHRCVLLLGESIDETTKGIALDCEVPQLKGWNSDRMELRGFRALIEPLTKRKARTCIVANLDLKTPIPKRLLNFGIKKMAGILLYLLMKEAEKIEHAQQENLPNEHLARIQNDYTQFYSWLRPRLEKWFEDKAKNLLPATLSINPSSSLYPVSTSRTGSSSSLNGGLSLSSTTFSSKKSVSNSSSSPTSLKSRTPTKSSSFDSNPLSSSDGTSVSRALGRRTLIDYLYDFGIWPYFLLFIFAKVTPEDSFLYVCVLKCFFACTCTWFGVPGAFSWQSRQMKRATSELDTIRRKSVLMAAGYDVLNSWLLKVWVNWFLCYAQWSKADRVTCSTRGPIEIRESENFWLMASAFVFASVVVGIQIVVNI